MLLPSKLLSLVIMLSVCLVNAIEISSYARVSRNGDSIIKQSDTRNESISSRVSDVESTLIDKQNETTSAQPPAKAREAKQMSSDEKSTGRAVKSNYYFPLPQLSKPVRRNRYSNEKSGRVIVYPSYSSNNRNSINPPRTRYNQRKPLGQNTAQRRFQYTPDSIYKFKGPGSSQGYQYAMPPTDSKPSPMKFNAPIVVPDMQSPQQAYLPPDMASQPSYLPPDMLPASPPKSSYIASDMMQPAPPQPSYLPPDMMPSPQGSPHFLPTPQPDETSSNPIVDLLAFPPHVNTSYLPSELDAIKDSINSNHQPPEESSSGETTYTPPSKLYNFPPNILSSYLPPSSKNNGVKISSNLQPPTGTEDSENAKSPVYIPPKDLNNFPPNIESSYLPPSSSYAKVVSNSYLPQPSGDSNGSSDDNTTVTTSDDSPYVAPKDLYNFPPNVDSIYLPPGMKSNQESPVNSYLPPASGDNSESSEEAPPKENPSAYIPPKDLYNFPPNIASAYLPPQMKANKNPSISSYLPPASGDNSEISEEAPPEENPLAYIPPKDLYNFPPNIASAYLPPKMKANSNPSISSYLPPASGDDTGSSQETSPEYSDGVDESAPYVPPQNLYNFPPNINSNYLPPEMKVPSVPNNSYLPPASGSETDHHSIPSYMYNPPSNPYPPSVQSSYLPPEMKQVMAPGYSYPPPSGSVSGFSDGSKQNLPGPMDSMDMPPSGPPMDDHDHDHHDHDHDHDHHDYPQYPDFHGHDIIYDDHHHHHDEPPETTTTEAPPEEPRVKKYSYYYLGRKLWYVPLYFTLWFCLYVAALIIRSIGRHKVDLPNHYVARSLHDMSHEETVQKINKMTEFAMQQIEDFKEKYL